MGKYDNYSVEDCNKCLAELNESFDKLTKQFEAKEIKRFQYNFNRKANAKQVNEVKARLAELTDKICERFMQFPTEEEKDAYIKDNGLEKDVDYKDKGINAIELLNESLFGPSDEVIADSKAKGLYTEDVNSSETYVYEYYSTEEDAEATANFIREQGRKAEVKPEGEEYAVWVSYEQEEPKQDIIDLMWSASCSNDQNYIKYAFDRDLIAPNTRYDAYNAKNSLIMGALRNKHFEMAELLKSFGEKILKAELPEYKRIMAEREYEDETTRTAMEESKKHQVAYNIDWDADNVTDLPKEIIIPEDITDEEAISDYITNSTGFCHKGFDIKEETKSLNTFYVAEELYNETHNDSWNELSDDEKAEFYNKHISEINSRAKVEESKPLTEEADEVSEEYEDYEDIDGGEETISLLDIAIKEIPRIGVEEWGKDNELYFTADTISLMEALKPFEEEIPKHYYDNADTYDWSNGVEDYLTSIGVDIDAGKGNNTYNWNAPLTHDINFTTYEYGDECYVKMEVHLAGDVRGNYSTAFLLKFDSEYDFHDNVSDVCAENCFRELKHNDKSYTITPNLFSETVDIYCIDTGDNWTDVYCTDLEGLEEIIKQPVEESKEVKTESEDDFGILLRELDGQSLYRAHAVKTIDGQDYASYLLKDKNGLGVLSFILPITGTEDIKAKIKAFAKENELKENASVTPEIQKHLDKLESDLLAIPNVTKVEFDTAGYLDGINAPITLVSYEIETQGEQYFNDLAELKSKVFATLEDNGVNIEKDEFEDNDTYFYIVAYSTNWDNKLTEAPTKEDAEYKKLCAEIEFQAEENDFTITEEDVKAIADKMIADKFFFNHDINADDNDEQAWEEINSLIVSAIEAHPNKIEESANDKVINAVRQGLSKHDVDNLSVDEDEEGNISVMYHSDKDSFPIVQNICKVVDIDKATLIPELDKLDVGKTFLTEDWEELEDNN